MKRLINLILLCLLVNSTMMAQHYVRLGDSSLILNNGLIERELVFQDGRLYTTSVTLKGVDLNFCEENKEFSFLIGEKYYDGSSGWDLASINEAMDKFQGSGAIVKLKGREELRGIELEISYLLYPDLPVIRKQIKICNNSGKEIMLESLDVEKLKLGFNYVHSVSYANYGRQKHLSTYIGDWDDPLLPIHSYQKNAGIILGNEAPGVLKRIDYSTNINNANIGLTHVDDIYPFRKYISPGKEWTAPKTFIIPYAECSDPWQVMNTTLQDFERRHMGLRIYSSKNRPVFVFNTWRGFRKDLSHSLMIDVGKAASECGFQIFTVDDGWFVNQGDWVVDSKKFPEGLQSVFNETEKAGLRSGLWISLATSYKTSRILEEHPEWAVRDAKGDSANLHNLGQTYMITMCFGTSWKDYIMGKIAMMVKSHNLKYVKLDLAVLSSAYINDYSHSGCYSTDHPYHRDREESFIVIYERLFELLDELHDLYPELYVDCTFEVTGKMQLIDYAFCQHAEANWLTNVEDPYPVGAFRIRNLTWWKSPAVPASSLLIGNIAIESPDFIEELKSMVGSVPVVLGDPRKLSTERRKEIKQWADWLKSMQEKYGYDLYRQDLTGFGEPSEGNWDGWSRINTDTKRGGIIGIFRQGSLDNARTVSLAGLDKDGVYVIREAPGQKEIGRKKGKEFLESGFKVDISKYYGGRLFEIELVDN